MQIASVLNLKNGNVVALVKAGLFQMTSELILGSGKFVICWKQLATI